MNTFHAVETATTATGTKEQPVFAVLVFTTVNTVQDAARAAATRKVQHTTTSRGEDKMELIKTPKDDH